MSSLKGELRLFVVRKMTILLQNSSFSCVTLFEKISHQKLLKFQRKQATSSSDFCDNICATLASLDCSVVTFLVLKIICVEWSCIFVHYRNEAVIIENSPSSICLPHCLPWQSSVLCFR